MVVSNILITFATDLENNKFNQQKYRVMLQVKCTEKIISVISDYNPKFVRKARALHGTWNKPAWEFNVAMEKAVRKALMDCYGDDGMGKSVKVRINLDECCCLDNGESLYLSGKCLIGTRFSRDSSVKLPADVFCVGGYFKEHGGSVAHPLVTWEDGTIVEMDIPQSVYDECKDDNGITLVDDNTNKRAALEEEKKKLLQRIAEIDKELSNL